MTRSHKFTDRDHSGETVEAEHVPRYFAKSGHADADPTKTKKNGGGKGNWGREGDEIEDFDVNMNNPRRRSNSSSATHPKDFKSKFETIEPEPVFEEELHGPVEGLENSEVLENVSTGSTDASVDEEEKPKKA